MSTKAQYKCLTFIAMLYLMVWITTLVFGRKLIAMPVGVMAASTLSASFGYLFDDLIAEVYGYKIARQIFIYALIIVAIFNIICSILSHLPAPANWPEQVYYQYILNQNFIREICSIISSIIAWRLNVYLLLKWKFILNSKYYWLRSFGSSVISETLYMLLLLIPIKFLYANNFISIVVWSYSIRMLSIILLLMPYTFLTHILKIIENVDNSKEFIFNPFRKNTSSTTPSN